MESHYSDQQWTNEHQVKPLYAARHLPVTGPRLQRMIAHHREITTRPQPDHKGGLTHYTYQYQSRPALTIIIRSNTSEQIILNPTFTQFSEWLLTLHLQIHRSELGAS